MSYHINNNGEECKNILKNITNNGYSKLTFIPLLPLNKEKQLDFQSVAHEKIGNTHRNQSIRATRKYHKLTLSKVSNFKAENSICRKQGKSLNMK